MGTLRKFLFILYSRRPRGRLFVNQEKIGIIDKDILACSPTVKEKIAFGNSPGFQTHLDEFGLKCCLLGDDPENKRKESSFFRKVFLSCPI
jgi:hypothetical protein